MKQLMRRLSRVSDSSLYTLLRTDPNYTRHQSDDGGVPIYVGDELERFVVVYTIFIDGLNPCVNPYCLRFMSKEFGNALDAFIPMKMRRNTTLKFGFIRFGSKLEALREIRELNGVRRFNNIIHVSMAKHKRGFTKEVVTKSTAEGSVMKKEFKSYKDAVKGNKSEERPSHLDSQKLKLKIERVENEWTKRSLVGKLPNIAMTNNIKEICLSEGVFCFDVKVLSGPYVLLIFNDVEDMEAMLENDHPWLRTWFIEKKRWSPDFFNDFRVTWINCIGIPIHAWDSLTFRKISEFWGEFIKVDENTRLETKFDKARILISTNASVFINQEVELQVDNIFFNVRIIEENVVENIQVESKFRRASTKSSSDEEAINLNQSGNASKVRSSESWSENLKVPEKTTFCTVNSIDENVPPLEAEKTARRKLNDSILNDITVKNSKPSISNGYTAPLKSNEYTAPTINLKEIISLNAMKQVHDLNEDASKHKNNSIAFKANSEPIGIDDEVITLNATKKVQEDTEEFINILSNKGVSDKSSNELSRLCNYDGNEINEEMEETLMSYALNIRTKKGRINEKFLGSITNRNKARSYTNNKSRKEIILKEAMKSLELGKLCGLSIIGDEDEFLNNLIDKEIREIEKWGKGGRKAAPKFVFAGV